MLFCWKRSGVFQLRDNERGGDEEVIFEIRKVGDGFVIKTPKVDYTWTETDLIEDLLGDALKENRL